MKHRSKLGFTVLIAALCALSLPTTAQENTVCPSFIQQALQSIDQVCIETGRNQACYGSPLLEAEPQQGIADLVFRQPGDRVDVAAIHTLRSSPLDTARSQWGLTLMRLQANLPDTLPGQNVVLLLVGEVFIENAVSRESSDSNSLRPMQAFSIRSGIRDAVCDEVPNSGLLIRTPQGTGEIRLRINETELHLGSTAFLEAEPGHDLVINVLQGKGRVQAFAVEQTLLSGMRTRIPIDDQLAAAGPPSAPEMCDEDDVKGLPGVQADCHHITITINEDCPAVIPFGMAVTLHFGSGWPSEAEAQQALNTGFSHMTINGQEVAVERFGPYFVDAYQHFAYGSNHEWGTPHPGLYHIVSYEQNATRSCDINILEKRGS